MSECVCLCASSLKSSGSVFSFFPPVAVSLLARGRFQLVEVLFFLANMFRVVYHSKN